MLSNIRQKTIRINLFLNCKAGTSLRRYTVDLKPTFNISLLQILNKEGKKINGESYFEKYILCFGCVIIRLLKQTNKQPATLQAHTRCVYIFLVTPRRSVTSKLIYPPAMRHHTKLFISLFLSVSLSLSLSSSPSLFLSPPVKPNQVCIKLNNALA